MAKLVLDNVTNLENQGSTVSTINSNSDLIEAAIENTVSRSGLSPNQMAAQLDMNNNKIINLPSATSGGDAVSLNKLDTSLTASTVRYDIPQHLNPLQQQQARDNINVDIFGGAGSSGGGGNITSVFGRTGVILPQTGDYVVGQVSGAAPIESPTFTGTPAASTAAVGNNTTQLATTAFVLANVGSGAVPSVFGRTGSVTAASGDYSAGQITNVPAGGIGSLTVQSALNELDFEKANLVSPTFTGNPMSPTPSLGDNDTSIATTAFVQTALATSFKNVTLQTFTTSGTYTPSTGMLFAIIECVGGGGGGGGCVVGATQCFAGAGGGAGAYSRKRVTAADIGASKIVTVGAGGSPIAFNGATGGDTSVGSLCVAKGGIGGGGSSISVVGNGGPGGSGSVGGVAGVGDITTCGSPGGSGFYASTTNAVVTSGGVGGSSFFGGGAQSTWSIAGVSGRSYGGGGSGASSNANGTTFNGGLGFAGVVIITEFS